MKGRISEAQKTLIKFMHTSGATMETMVKETGHSQQALEKLLNLATSEPLVTVPNASRAFTDSMEVVEVAVGSQVYRLRLPRPEVMSYDNVKELLKEISEFYAQPENNKEYEDNVAVVDDHYAQLPATREPEESLTAVFDQYKASLGCAQEYN